MLSNLKLTDKILILVTVPIVFMLVFVGILAMQQRAAQEEAWQERHARDIVSESNSLMHSCMDAGAALFLYKSSRREIFLNRFDDLLNAIPEQISTLKLLIRDDAKNRSSLEELERSSTRAIGLMNQYRQTVQLNIGNDAELSRQWGDASAEMLASLQKFVAQQKQKQRPSGSELARQHAFSALLYGGVIASIVLAVMLAVFFNKSTTKKFILLVDDTQRLARGDSLHAVLQGTDEIARLHQFFHKMADDLARADKKKQELLAIVSHDLRSPLTGVNSALSLMEEGVYGDLTPKAHQVIRTSQLNLSRLIDLINDLLDIEKMKSGKIQITPRQVVVEELFERICETLDVLAESKSIALEYDPSEHVAVFDYDRITQVLVNLVSNAIKFSPESSTIRLRSDDSDGGIKISVIDQGRGISAEDQAKLFKRFQQVEESDAQIGTGLGLSICKEFVEAHGGKIGVESGKSYGSVFWFWLPAANLA